MRPTRRELLAGLALGGASMALPGRRARADVSAADRKFIFVFVNGGWDTTRVFTPEFGHPIADMEEDAALATVGELRFVDHPERPAVRTFLEHNLSRVNVLNGLLVPSVAHEACTGLLFTGGTSGRDPDWATRIAASRRFEYSLPHLVLGSVGFGGELAETTSRIGRSGQLLNLLDGSATQGADLPYDPPDSATEALIDQLVAARLDARIEQTADPARRAMLEDAAYASARAEDLQLDAGAVDFSTGSDLIEAGTLAAQVLSAGISRCVTIEHPVVQRTYIWDSHSENNTRQSALFEDLFASLEALMLLLDATPGTAGGSLSDETAVVVLSEMGRAPWMNPAEGKDHWLYTSAMFIGSGFAGNGRVIGGLDESFFGKHIDLATGDLAPGGVRPSFNELGATLLALGDVDPADWLEVPTPIAGLLR